MAQAATIHDLGDGSPETFRFQISDSSGNIVYDNGVQQTIAGGSIVIHR